MNILVINGSPKGKYSITIQTVNYLERLYKEHQFQIIHAGQMINGLEKNFNNVNIAIENADLILFSYPVYTFIAPSQLHRFIELLKKQNLDLSSKYVSQITTSKHFYDITAHKYIQENCQELKMKFIRGLSADMDDLPSEKGQKDAKAFFDYVLWCMKNDYYEAFPPTKEKTELIKVTASPIITNKLNHDVAIVTDCDNEQLATMIERFQNILPVHSRVINLNDLRIDGGCLGCFNCATDGKCIYKDRFDEYLRDTIQQSDAIIYAYTIKDHSMGSLFKKYDDRQFCNGHRTVTMGMPIGYLVSGNLSHEENLRTIMEARSEVGGNYHVGIANDEFDPDTSIDQLANKLTYALEHKLVQPANFYGVGGMKIFRDLIYTMQGMMKADHKFFKSHNQYDFPQKKKGTILFMYLVGFMLSKPKIKAKLGNNLNEGMLIPYTKLFEKMDKQKS